MSLLSWFDNRTLFGCQCMLAVMFAVVFFWIDRVYPTVRGVRSIAIALLLEIPCTLLLLERGHLPFLVSVVIGNLLGLTVGLLLYNGVMRFVGAKNRVGVLAAVSLACLVVVTYFSAVRLDIVPRIVAMSLDSVLLRGLTAWELLRRATGGVVGRRFGERLGQRIGLRHRPDRGVMLFFGLALAGLAAVSLERGIYVVLHGATETLMERNEAHSRTLTLNVIWAATYGFCFLLMAGHRLIAEREEMSERDVLSGSFNRRGIEQRLKLELKRASRHGQELSVALIDIDHFKSINERCGYAAGDAAIREVASALQGRLRGSDLLGRYGGDEFLLVLPQTGCQNAVVAAERLSQAVNEAVPQVSSRGLVRPITLSMGIAEAGSQEDAIGLIARANEALYRAKSSGRACLRLADQLGPAMPDGGRRAARAVLG